MKVKELKEELEALIEFNFGDYELIYDACGDWLNFCGMTIHDEENKIELLVRRY